MGTTCCCCVDFFSSMEAAEWIALFGVVVNGALAYWIVRTIQNKLTNKRVLKDHFIEEIKEIRNEYRAYLSALYSNNTHSHLAIPWFKLMNIKVGDLISIIHTKYRVDKDKLKPYQIELRDLITDNEDFKNQYKNNEKTVFSEASRTELIKFQQSHNQLFNEIIITINDAE